MLTPFPEQERRKTEHHEMSAEVAERGPISRTRHGV